MKAKRMPTMKHTKARQTMSGSSSKQKGKAGEREFAKLLGEALQLKLSRNLQQTREGGQDLLGLPGYAIEVKRQEATNVAQWWKQACRQAHGDDVPVLAYRPSRKPWTICMALRDTLPGCEQLDRDLFLMMSIEAFVQLVNAREVRRAVDAEVER